MVAGALEDLGRHELLAGGAAGPRYDAGRHDAVKMKCATHLFFFFFSHPEKLTSFFWLSFFFGDMVSSGRAVRFIRCHRQHSWWLSAVWRPVVSSRRGTAASRLLAWRLVYVVGCLADVLYVNGVREGPFTVLVSTWGGIRGRAHVKGALTSSRREICEPCRS